jgi:hypothetical protein
MDAPADPSQDASQDISDNNTTVQSLSINQLAARNARERLLVRPVRWTGRQLALLDCRFHWQGEGGQAEGMPTEYRRPESSDLDSERITLRLNQEDNFWDRTQVIDDLLSLVSELHTLSSKYLYVMGFAFLVQAHRSLYN